jgi:hypothetical protein
MNRSIALFVALVTLLAHALAIHNDGEGSFAFPYDRSYVAFRLARNLVFDGQLAWNPGMSAFESHSSVLWVGICGFGERMAPIFHASMNAIVQTVGIVCMLLAVLLSSRFRTDRIASLLAPLLLATSGCVAAAAANGLETALFTATALASFLALERGRPHWLGVSLSLCVLARPEGVIFVGAMLVLRLLGRPNDDEGERPRVSLAAFILPVLVVAATAVVRWRTSGFFLPPAAMAWMHPLPGQWRAGVMDLRDFMTSSVSPLLLAFPAWYLLRGMLSRTGAHAVFVALVWMIACGLRGRSTLPFHEALVPALPFIFLGAQEGLIVALDSTAQWKRRAAVAAITVSIIGSVLASKTPGDLGPIQFQHLHEAWMRPSGQARFGYEGALGRRGLQEEIAQTIRFRRVGLFLRDQIDAGSTILTPWPGSIGYLSRQPVYDVLGRTDPLHPLDRPNTWWPEQRVDTVALLQQDLDYVVPMTKAATSPLSRSDLARNWVEGLDFKSAEPGRTAEFERALDGYELITVPISEFVQRGQPRNTEPFYLLRARRLDARPRIEMRGDGGRFHVVLFHRNHNQLADLRITLVASDGAEWSLRPTGEVAQGSTVHARRGLLLYDTGSRGVELMRGKLPTPPDGLRWTEMRAVLRNPQARGEDPFAFESDEVRIAL